MLKIRDKIEEPASGGSYTNEEAQDAVGTILTDSATIDFTYNDGVPSITAGVIPNSIDADEINYDNATSGLVATDVQAAIDELAPSIPTSAGLYAAIHALSPTAYWRLNEASGNFQDSGPSNYDAVARGTIVYNSSALLPDAGSRYARFTTAANTYGETSSLLGVTPPFNDSWSVVALVNPVVGGNNSRYIFAISGASETEANNDQVLVYYSSSGLFAFWEHGSGTNVTIAGPNAMPANRPTLIHVVKDSPAKLVTFYINGAYAGSGTYTNEPTGGSSATAKVMGRETFGSEFVGGEVAFFNGTAHSTTQVETVAKAAGMMGK